MNGGLYVTFEIKNRDKLAYLTIPAFERTGLVKHGFSTRLGGISKAPYDALNLGFKKEDDRNNVLENYRIFCEALTININDLVASDQIHGSDIYIATVKDRGKGILNKSDIEGKDAIITRERNVALVTYYADCVPVLILDTKTPAVGLVHAGWRGTVQKIGQKTLYKMMEEFGSSPKDILIGIGPCIKNCCYEVDTPVVNALKEKYDYWEDLVTSKGNGKWMLDLVMANKRQLEDIGVKTSQISVSDFCTSCNNDLFFSFRADKGKTGSLAAVIQLK